MTWHIRLRALTPPLQGASWETREMLRVGRDHPCELLLEAPEVSRHHAVIRPTVRGWEVQDLESTNGTEVDGVLLRGGSQRLRPQSWLRFGPIRCQVDFLLDEPPSTLPPKNEMLSLSEALRWHGYESNPALPRTGPGWHLRRYVRLVGARTDRWRLLLSEAATWFQASSGLLFLPGDFETILFWPDEVSGDPGKWATPADSLARREPYLVTHCGKDLGELGESGPTTSLLLPLQEGDEVVALLVLTRDGFCKPFNAHDLLAGGAFCAAVIPELKVPVPAAAEQEWLQVGDPQRLFQLLFLNQHPSSFPWLEPQHRRSLLLLRPWTRKLLLFVCHCVRRYDLDLDVSSTGGLSRSEAILFAEQAAQGDFQSYAHHRATRWLPLRNNLMQAADEVLGVLRDRGMLRDQEVEGSGPCHLLRELFGNPFRPPTLDPAWLTWRDSAIPALAQGIDNEGRYEDLPILADALEEAGCTDAAILNHCRGANLHLPGCWVLDRLLGWS